MLDQSSKFNICRCRGKKAHIKSIYLLFTFHTSSAIHPDFLCKIVPRLQRETFIQCEKGDFFFSSVSWSQSLNELPNMPYQSIYCERNDPPLFFPPAYNTDVRWMYNPVCKTPLVHSCSFSMSSLSNHVPRSWVELFGKKKEQAVFNQGSSTFIFPIKKKRK